MRGIRAVIPVFEKQGGGVIVNTASIAGFTGARGGGAAYVASKHGLIGLTKMWHLIIRTRISVVMRWHRAESRQTCG